MLHEARVQQFFGSVTVGTHGVREPAALQGDDGVLVRVRLGVGCRVEQVRFADRAGGDVGGRRPDDIG